MKEIGRRFRSILDLLVSDPVFYVWCALDGDVHDITLIDWADGDAEGKHPRTPFFFFNHNPTFFWVPNNMSLFATFKAGLPQLPPKNPDVSHGLRPPSLTLTFLFFSFFLLFFFLFFSLLSLSIVSP